MAPRSNQRVTNQIRSEAASLIRAALRHPRGAKNRHGFQGIFLRPRTVTAIAHVFICRAEVSAMSRPLVGVQFKRRGHGRLLASFQTSLSLIE